MNKRSYLISSILILFLVNTFSFAQTDTKVAGKVFPHSEAEKLFGPVQTSVKLPVELLKDQLRKVDDYIMFKVINNDVAITDKSRNTLRAAKGVRLGKSAVMHKYSKRVVEDLLSKGKADYVFFEKRNEVLTVTNGAFTMEFSTLCPPMCD